MDRIAFLFAALLFSWILGPVLYSLATGSLEPGSSKPKPSEIRVTCEDEVYYEGKGHVEKIGDLSLWLRLGPHLEAFEAGECYVTFLDKS